MNKTLLVVAIATSLSAGAHAQSSKDELASIKAETMILAADAARIQAQRDANGTAAPLASPAASASPSDAERARPRPVVSGVFAQDGVSYYTVTMPNGTQTFAHAAGEVLAGGEWKVISIGSKGPEFALVGTATKGGRHAGG